MCLDMTIIVCLVQNKKMPFKREKSMYKPTRFNPTFHNSSLLWSATERKLDNSSVLSSIIFACTHQNNWKNNKYKTQ